jgi:hypothetical protein
MRPEIELGSGLTENATAHQPPDKRYRRDRPNREIHQTHQFHQISLVVDELHRRVVSLFS